MSGSGFAQTASQIVPPSFRPNLERPGGFTLPGTPGLVVPAGAEKLFVRLSGVSIKGGLPQLAAASGALEARLAGQKVSGADIFAAARELEAAYARAGYVLVRVVLPPQQLSDGARLKLVVIDGFIERVETRDVPERVRGRIMTLVGSLTGRRGLTLGEIERRVVLAGDIPGVILRSTLMPGKGDGATVLVIDATHQAVSETLTFDNTLSKALGRTTLGAGLDLNSVGGFGELVYLRAGGHPDGGDNGWFDRYPRNRTLAAGIVVPLWVDGLTFNAEYTDARTTPLAVAGMQTTDTFERLSLRLRYAWLRERTANFNSELALDAQDELQSLFVAGVPTPLSQDRLRIVRFTNDGDLLTPWGGTVSGRATASFGLDGLGARTAAEATPLLPLSRQGADASFRKFDISLGYSQTVIEHLAVSVTARAQTSFNAPLLRSEQIGIANTTGLSAFDAGTVVGDQGYVVRGELSSPWALPVSLPMLQASGIGVVAAPYLFAAYGEVTQRDPTALEAASIRATSYGAGLRLGGAALGRISNGSLSLEYGHATRSDGVAAGDRFTVVSAFRF
ncbi:ShlB/FhaC/HecB family hemolysin secretion/activation protein [Bradyrhizobium sp. U87765 SZCCT0131]|nr:MULTISPECIES: ShlB/FhaC/HecB family hemolysin secretion/activation protein [unclassified Bradyrhizobium]MBR1219887.1 ShlB/FhaC/HecB family hemolysin secretion/activation protein [Bradyrhizobium sp. U87765 SZCCT0131]MBR1262538.1 ShlB/FhaC/HecB family hemolysin secretion/activation protein [Bradyrhizobium sp. U87765 SZCCT0134]MBR1308279.1 ShlB/FhaC/HecB family hemolysin secretion/activation protein [Bradyrhizobium sp. U87765 SZCCT0110]MBR1318320.1 ShlB/FhaC/HecB family hemolysin secretion/acti